MACVEFVADKRTKALFADDMNIGEKIHVRGPGQGLAGAADHAPERDVAAVDHHP
jgi:hypothetical protein